MMYSEQYGDILRVTRDIKLYRGYQQRRDNATLNRFFSLHFLLPFLLAALVVLHFIALHHNGSNNPLAISTNCDKISFHPYYSFKDIVGVFVFFLILSIFIFYIPNYLGQILF